MEIAFIHRGDVYIAPEEFRDTNRAVLPDGTVITVKWKDDRFPLVEAIIKEEKNDQGSLLDIAKACNAVIVREVEPKHSFHTTVARFIQEATGPQFELLSQLLEITRIPDNHVSILEAWSKRRKELDFSGHPDLPKLLHDQRVVEVTKQKDQAHERLKEAERNMQDMAGW